MKRSAVIVSALAFLCAAIAPAWAADDAVAPEPDAGSGPAADSVTPPSGRVFFDMRLAAAPDDFQMGGRAGFFAGRRVLIDVFLDFEVRPYRRAVRIRESETLEYQYREERFTFGPGFLARIPLGRSPAAWVAGGGASLSPAWYRGSRRAAESSALAWLETGVRFWSPPSGAEGGFSYQFFPLPGVSSHRISFHLGYRLDAR